MRRKQIFKGLQAVGIILCLFTVPVMAQSSSSNSYRVDEYQFGSGGELENTSANFKAQTSVGSLGVGRSSSTNYDLEAGFITPSEPFLELFVNFATVDLGTLDPSTTGTGTGTFWVRTYLSSSYTVQTMSQPPTSEGGAVIDAKGTLGAPAPGTEEFGINLVDNSGPDIGADPFNVPDNTFADGTVATGYDTPNEFKYGVGDVIARAAASIGNQAVGRTDYTISYIANINPITEAGNYSMVHDVVAVATF